MTIKNKPHTRQNNEFSYPNKVHLYWMILVLLMAFNIANAQVNENFEDNDLLSNPSWQGDLAKFQTVGGQLISSSKITNDRFFLSTSNKRFQQTQWEFKVNLAFNTSSVNYIDVFLISDSAILTGANSGYFLRIGGTEDEISLYKKTGVTTLEILDGKNGKTNNSSNVLNIKVIYDSSKFFNVWIDTSGSGDSYLMEGRIQESVLLNCSYFGFLIRQSTSGFFQKHILDDLYVGPILTDTIPPKVIGWKVLNQDTLILIFSEKILTPRDVNSVEINYSIGNPISFQPISGDSTQWKVALAGPLVPYQNYTLTLKSLIDYLGNTLKDTHIILRWVPVFEPKTYELLITEWMPDPDPKILLPEEEFIEIMNNSGHALQLYNCRIDDGTTIGHLPEMTLEKDSFLILCRAGAESKFSSYGKVVGLKSFPSLNNSEDLLNLRSSKGDLLHRVVYDINTYQDILKSQGGWSIEMIDPRNPCGKLNYKASDDMSGGTPGMLNSVWGQNSDQSKPLINRVKVKNETRIFVEFDEMLDSSKAVVLSNIEASELQFLSISLNLNVLEINLSKPPETGKMYTFQLKNITDCVENKINDTLVSFALPEAASKGDILISEILFNPPAGGVDFIELYNASDKILTLKGLSLFNFSEVQTIENAIYLDTSGELFFPHSYKVLCTNPEWVLANYSNHNASVFFKLNSWVSMDDDKGYIGISNIGGEILDELEYHEQMHWPLLTDREGVSLERISFETNVEVSSNFTSAAATYGFATPGLPNSHHRELIENTKWINIEPDLFSPDDDGNDDLLGVSIKTDCSDCQAFIRIFNAHGQLIHEMVNNIPIGNAQTWFWDGITDNGKKADIGIYIVFAELYGISQKRKSYKKTITVGGR